MEKVFNKDYAFFYDIFYRNKRYKKECEFLKSIFKQFSAKSPKCILDVACGTGGHANILAKMGYSVTGVDASASMLERARGKAEKKFLKVKYHQMRMQDLKFGNKFDTVISMFSAIDYLIDYNDLRKFIKSAMRYLKKGSLFIFDFWNGAAVLNYYTPYKKREFIYKNLIIQRESKTDIFPLQNLCRINYKVSVLDKVTKKKNIFRESHMMRYFFIDEIKSILEKYGFSVLAMFPYLSLKGEIKINDPNAVRKIWDITMVAKKRG